MHTIISTLNERIQGKQWKITSFASFYILFQSPGFLHRDLKNHSTACSGCDFIKNCIINFEYFPGKPILVKALYINRGENYTWKENMAVLNPNCCGVYITVQQTIFFKKWKMKASMILSMQQ